MQSYNDIIKKYADIALSDKQLLRLINHRANIILYPEIFKYLTVDEMLYPYDACIILFESQPNYGHWCCLFKADNNLLEFFNPYGGWPDDSLDYIPEEFRIKTNQDYPYLSKLMYESPYELSFNEHKFQKLNKNIKTCGRHCAFRLHCRILSLKEYTYFVKTLCKKLSITPDELVTIATMFINK